MSETMRERWVQFGEVRYPFRHGVDCTDAIVDALCALEPDRFVFVVDGAVASTHAVPVLERLRRRASVIEVSLPASERTKSIELVASTLELAFRAGMTRRSCVVAMGGGVVGNMAGLAAALAFRGVRLVHLPTTIIAAMDSVLSLKQAVNGRLGKNLVGTFHAPTAVMLDLRWLTTLAPRDVRSGLCELAKNALAIVPESLGLVTDAGRSAESGLSVEPLGALVGPAIDAKLRVMGSDAREKQRGLVLEYGHTVGHAIELAAPGLLGHGEAVGIGMLVAADVAARRFGLPEADVDAHRRVLGAIGVTSAMVRHVPPARVLELLPFDNKRGYLAPAPDEVPMILLERVGHVRGDSLPLTPVKLSDVADALASWGGA